MSSEMSKEKTPVESLRKMGQTTTLISDRLKVLSEGEIDAIVEAACKVLGETGFVYQYEPALKVLKSAGAQVDFNTQTAKLPRDLIEAALKTVPRSWCWQGRTPEYDVWVDPAHLRFHAAGAVYMFDRVTKKQRTMQLKDIGEWHTFVDHLDNYHANQPTAAAYDAPQQLQGSYIVAEQIKYSKKPIMSLGPIGVIQDADVQLELCDIAGRQILGLTGPVSPLCIADNMCHELMLWAERRWPIAIWSGPTPGAIAPMTLAGTMVVTLSEILAMLVLAQIVGPGTPMDPAFEAMFLDMKNGASYSGVEGILGHIAFAQIMHRFGMATHSGVPQSTAATADWQDGVERGNQLLGCALGGVNAVMLGNQSMYMNQSYADLVRGDALISYVKRFLRGIEVTPETLAVDVIQEVGPLGTYLGKKHTKQYVKTELFVPKLFSTAGYDVWLAEGGKDTITRSEEMAEQIWKGLKPDPIDEDKCRKIDALLKKELAKYE